jgi:hypothetical protein
VVANDQPLGPVPQEVEDVGLADRRVEEEHVVLGMGRGPPGQVAQGQHVAVQALVEEAGVDVRRADAAQDGAQVEGGVGDGVAGRGADQDLVDLHQR